MAFLTSKYLSSEFVGSLTLPSFKHVVFYEVGYCPDEYHRVYFSEFVGVEPFLMFVEALGIHVKCFDSRYWLSSGDLKEIKDFHKSAVSYLSRRQRNRLSHSKNGNIVSFVPSLFAFLFIKDGFSFVVFSLLFLVLLCVLVFFSSLKPLFSLSKFAHRYDFRDSVKQIFPYFNSSIFFRIYCWLFLRREYFFLSTIRCAHLKFCDAEPNFLLNRCWNSFGYSDCFLAASVSSCEYSQVVEAKFSLFLMQCYFDSIPPMDAACHSCGKLLYSIEGELVCLCLSRREAVLAIDSLSLDV